MGGTLSQELKLAEELKKYCDDHGKEICTWKSAEVLNKFGLLYKNKSDRISLIRSAAFFNAACIRQPENKKYLKDLQELCYHVLQVANAEKRDADLVKVSKDLFVFVEKMRGYARSHVNTLKAIPYNINIDQMVEMESEKIETIKAIQNKVTDNFIELMNAVAIESEKILGDAPCKYAIVGMGSLARREITPFSDFEHIIVLKDGVEMQEDYQEILEYFRWFTVVFHIIVINFQETIIRSVAVPLLNDGFVTGGDWFYDAHTRCGIKFDGMQVHACKFPLGKTQVTMEHPYVVELIKPMSKMADYVKEEEDLKNGYHLADILTRTCFVSGSRKVSTDFEEKVSEMLSNEQGIGSREITEQIQDTINKFASFKKLGLMNGVTKFDIKRLIYRGTTMFISCLGRLFEFKEKSCFDIIKKMLENEFITHEWAHKLSYSVAIACEVRMKVYLKQNGQDDIFGIRDFEIAENRTLRELQDIVGEKSLADYFTIAHTLQMALISNKPGALKTMQYSCSDRFLILTCLDLRNLYDFELNQIRHGSDINENLIKSCKKQDEQEKEHKKIEFNKNDSNVQNLKNNLTAEKTDEETVDESNKEENKIILLTACQEYAKGNLKKALQHYEYLDQQAEIDPLIKTEVVRSIAGLLHDSHKYEDTVRYILENVEVIKNLGLPPARPLTFIYVTLGNCWRYLKVYSEAFSAYQMSLEYQQQLTTLEQNTPFILRNAAACYFGISDCQWNLDDYETALKNAKKALNIWNNDTNSETILLCICYGHIAKCYLLMGEFDEALFNLKKELSLRLKYIPLEEHETNEEIRNCLSLIARVLAEKNAFSPSNDIPSTSMVGN